MELDFKVKHFNLFDVLTRRREKYHDQLAELTAAGPAPEAAAAAVKTIHQISRVKEAGLAELLQYDSYRRASWRDHFFPPRSNLQQPLTAVEAGDFADAPYEIVAADAAATAHVELARQGLVRLAGRDWPVTVHKTILYRPQQGELHYDYRLLNRGAEEISLDFAVEFNINFLAGAATDRYYSWPGQNLARARLNSRGRTENVSHFGLVDEWQGLSTFFRFDRAAVVWRQPVETVSQSEEGLERVYQGSMLLFAWPVKLLPRTPWLLSFSQSITELVGEDS